MALHQILSLNGRADKRALPIARETVRKALNHSSVNALRPQFLRRAIPFWSSIGDGMDDSAQIIRLRESE